MRKQIQLSLTYLLFFVPLQGGDFFSYKDWLTFQSEPSPREDVVKLPDGTIIAGTVVSSPEILFSCGTFAPPIDEIRVLIFNKREDEDVIQVIMYDGRNYIGKRGATTFAILTKDHQKYEITDPEERTFVHFNLRNPHISKINKQLASIHLVNGDQFPALLDDENLLLTNGWEKISLPTNEILEISFNGGVSGKILKNGKESELNFHFITERSLAIHIPGHSNAVRVPWEHIHLIQGKNGGFEKSWQSTYPEKHIKPQLTNPISNDPPKAVVELNPFESHSIGAKKGTLLQNFHAAVVNESLSMNRLFKDEESELWDLNIAFEEDTPSLLDVSDVKYVSNAYLFDLIQRVDADPEEFDVIALSEEPTFSFNRHVKAEKEFFESQSTPESSDLLWDSLDNASIFERLSENQKKLLDEILGLEENSSAAPPPVERNLMAYVPPSKSAELLFPEDTNSYTIVLVPTLDAPQKLVLTKATYIDRYPVTNSQYSLFVEATKQKPPLHWIEGKAPSEEANKPVVQVSLEDAKAYALWAGKRLPTATEWSLALQEGAIQPIELMEWTATAVEEHQNKVLSEKGANTFPNSTLHAQIGFRTALNNE